MLLLSVDYFGPLNFLLYLVESVEFRVNNTVSGNVGFLYLSEYMKNICSAEAIQNAAKYLRFQPLQIFAVRMRVRRQGE